MDYEKMWYALRHALIEQSSDCPENPFYPAVILIMSAMEWYSQEQAKKTEDEKASV